jgi:hypothetical protein
VIPQCVRRVEGGEENLRQGKAPQKAKYAAHCHGLNQFNFKKKTKQFYSFMPSTQVNININFPKECLEEHLRRISRRCYTSYVAVDPEQT